MIEYLDSLDKSLLLFLNGFHNPFFDNVMWSVSKTATWILMGAILLYLMFRENWRRGVLVVLGIALTITLADQISSGIIKGIFERLRPARSPEIGHLAHIVNNYRGGGFSFVSSHAANTMGVAMFIALLYRNRMITLSMIFWAALVSYSRIYLGMHYPGDVLGGICVGLASGAFVYWLYKCAENRWENVKNDAFAEISEKNAKIMTCGIWGNLLITVGVSAFLCFVA